MEGSYKALIEKLRTLMDECDKEYIVIANQLRRNRKLISYLLEQNKKMDEREKKVFGRKNNKLIRETKEKNKWIRQGLALNNPLNKFDSECRDNGLDYIRLREIFSEERGWSILEL